LGTPANPRVPLRRIARLFRPYRWNLLFVGVLVAASSLVSLVNPFLIRAVIDVALPQGRTGLLAFLALGMIVVAILNSSFGVSQTYVSTQVGQRVMHDLRSPSSPGPAPARCSPASPTTSAACRPPSRPPPPPWSPT
jgi:ATP-binding cassette subfamily B protein